MKFTNILFKAVFSLGILIIFQTTSFANGSGSNSFEQQEPSKIKIEGTILDENSEPLPGVSILVKGTTHGVVTDFDGKFAIEVEVGSILRISFIGYETEEITVEVATTLNINLTPDVETLETIVVIGYGTQKKTTVTGSVSVIKGDELAKIPTPNISQSMAGKVAGVSMRPNGGQPGFDDPDIHIRGIVTTGNNRPLVVVDGIKRNNIRQINPNTIESLTILKDAAAVAPYGIGGANGVILITTKKGKSGKPKVVLNSSYGFQNPTYIPQMLSAQDYLKLSNEAYFNATPTGVNPPNSEEFIADYNRFHAQDPDLYPDSDFTTIINRWQPMQNHSLEFSGGTDKATYFASLGYYDQQGVFDPLSYNRYNYSLNLEMKATETTKIGVSMIGTFEDTNDMDPGENAYHHIWRAGYKFVPTQALMYSDDEHWGQSAGSTPVGALSSDGYKRFKKNTLLTSITVDQEIPWVEGLSVKGVFSYDPTQETIKEWHQPFKYHILNTDANPYTFSEAISTQEGNSPLFTYLSQGHNKWQNFTYQAYINYANTFGDHSVNAVFVAEGRKNTFETFWARKENYQLDIDELDFGPSDKDYFNNGGSSGTGSELGYVYRLTYSYKDKYMLETAGRYDGHYFFAPGQRWSFFPSVSTGWRVSEESFMHNYDIIDNLKLRGSWGKSGMLAGGPFQYMPGYNLYGNGYVFGTSTIVQGAYTDIEPNPNITWEISTKYDIGIDLEMWNGLLNLEFDFFHEDRTGMLLAPQVTLPVEYGLWLAQENKGVMKNNGFEFTLGSRKYVNEDLEFGISGNLSYAKN
ncbi:MAG: TonB-dependent receptor, partial [Bacteroidota bacterium]